MSLLRSVVVSENGTDARCARLRCYDGRSRRKSTRRPTFFCLSKCVAPKTDRVDGIRPFKAGCPFDTPGENHRKAMMSDEPLVVAKRLGKWRAHAQQQAFVRVKPAPFRLRQSIADLDGAVGRALTDGPVTLSCQMRRQTDATDRRSRRRYRNSGRRGFGRWRRRRWLGHALAGRERQAQCGCQRSDEQSGHGLVRVCAIRF